MSQGDGEIDTLYSTLVQKPFKLEERYEALSSRFILHGCQCCFLLKIKVRNVLYSTLDYLVPNRQFRDLAEHPTLLLIPTAPPAPTASVPLPVILYFQPLP